MKTPVKGALIATAVAALFAAKGVLAQEQGAEKAQSKKVRCEGVNECKGKGACDAADHACAGKNSCKGKGWLELSAAECKAKGGTIKQ